MKILEVRDGFIKFEADKNIYLSSFVQISGIEKKYIAQVIQLKRSGENSIAYAKILFLYDGSLQNYDKTLPSKESEIKEFTFDILSNSIKADTPVIAGKTYGNKYNIVIDKSAFDKKLLVSVDDKNENNLLVRNFVNQFEAQNVVIIDTLGVVEAKKYIAGTDFKLPLDTESLAFMYEDCLNDATADSKSLIVEIFRDLAEYSKSVPFVPFEALKSIVDDMVDKSHIFKLLVLKNKLAKFDSLGYFAKNKHEVEIIDKILDAKCAVIDLSKLDTAFQNRYLAFIYEKLRSKQNTQVFLELSNIVSKKNIKRILSDEQIATTFITHSKFKYLNDIKNIFDNFIIAPSFANNSIFNIYGTFLNSMPKGTYLLAGEAINYIPLVSQFEVITETVQTDAELEAIAGEEENLPEEEAELLITENTATTTSPENEISQIPNERDLDLIQNISVPETPAENLFGESYEETETEETNTSEIADEQPEELSAASFEQEEQSNFEFEAVGEELNESDEISDTAELPPEESFETEVHPAYEIQDYETPDTEYIQEPEEIQDFQELTKLENPEGIPADIADESSVPIEELSDAQDEHLGNISEEAETIEISDDLDFDNELAEPMEEIQELPELPQEQTFSEPEAQEPAVIPISDEASDEIDFDEIVELNPDEADENDIIIDMTEDEELSEDIDREIVKDVDKVFTTRKDDDISDTDLDFIDELNSGDSLEELQEPDELEELAPVDEGILEEPKIPREEELKDNNPEILETRNSSTPIVPVYDADIPQEDMVISDPIQQGDTVFHAKYGSGVVEKMIKYGNKTLFSINFDNIGRRLLDPTLTEIKKS